MEKTIIKSEYQLQAEKFLADTKTSFEAELVGHGPYFEGDTESRDIYKITLTRQELRPFIFKFGQSIVHSGPSIKEDYKYTREFMRSGRMVAFKPEHFEQKRQAPNAHDVLATLTKNDPETFEDFCNNYGYDTDSRKAEKVYFAVQKEYKEVIRLFNDVINQLLEIQ